MALYFKRKNSGSGNQEAEGVAPLPIIPSNPRGTFVFPILNTLGSAGIEVPLQKEMHSAKEHSFL